MLDFIQYTTTLPYATRKQDAAVNEAYARDQARLEDQFRTDALAAVKLTGHPKADKAFALAWSIGHACGYSEVFNYLQDIAEVVKD